MQKIKLLMLADLRSAHTKKWAEILSDSGLEVHVFGLTQAGEEFMNVTLHPGNIARDTASAGETSVKKLGYFFELKRLKRLIRKINPDIVHAHYASSYGLLGALAGRKPYFISVWGSDVVSFPKKSPVHKRMVEYALSRADLVFSTSEFMAEIAQKYTDKEIVITPFGVDISKFSPAKEKRSGETVRIGIIKTLSASYGQEYLLRAFALVKGRLPQRKLELEITGSGNDLDKLKSLANELGITDSVKFSGYVMQDSLPAVHQNLDIEVYPTVIEETFGVSTVEAMSCGVPCIVSKTGGLQFLVEDGVSGFHVPVKDYEAIADVLERLILDEELRRNSGAAARKRVEENYDIRQNAGIMLERYRRILQKKG
ncbi:MAG: glycosyltransferase [Ignavibacteria bacterium]|nr:glycosyltransferase [Ignavibacteria bacterium]